MVWWVPSLIKHIQNKTYEFTHAQEVMSIKWKTVEGVQSFKDLGIIIDSDKLKLCAKKGQRSAISEETHFHIHKTVMTWFDCSSVDPLSWFGYLWGTEAHKLLNGLRGRLASHSWTQYPSKPDHYRPEHIIHYYTFHYVKKISQSVYCIISSYADVIV